MASIRKVGDKWLVEVRLKGQYQSKTHATKNEAKDWAYEQEHKLKNSKGLLLGKTLGNALRKYADEVTPTKKGARWEELRIRKIERDDIASMQLVDVTSEDITKWIKIRQDDGLLGSSINRELSLLSAVFIRARDYWNWLEVSPMKTIKKLKEPPHREQIISDEQRDKILIALGYEEDKPIISHRQTIAVTFLFAMETCMRYGEIYKMDWKDINWARRFVRLFDTKNGENRDVPLSKRAIQLLQKLKVVEKGQVIRIKKTSSETLFRRAVDLAGFKGVIHFHDTRHTAITRLASTVFKNDILDLAKMTGHRDPRLLMTYYNPTPEAIADRLG